MRDACDAESFNAEIGPGTCVDAGNVTFDEMIASLVKHGNHPLWRNTPTTRTVHHGAVVDVAHVGGEFHTFSHTEEFGGGFVPELNEVLGLEEIADGCLLDRGRRTRSSRLEARARSTPPSWSPACTSSCAASTRGCNRR